MSESNNSVTVSGEKVAVSNEVYNERRREAWREAKRAKSHAKRERSYDEMVELDIDAPTVREQALVADIVEDKMLLETLFTALAVLTEDEYALIDAIFYRKLSEREYSRESGIPQKTINNRKKSILKKLKKFF